MHGDDAVDEKKIELIVLEEFEVYGEKNNQVSDEEYDFLSPLRLL